MNDLMNEENQIGLSSGKGKEDLGRSGPRTTNIRDHVHLWHTGTSHVQQIYSHAIHLKMYVSPRPDGASIIVHRTVIG